MSGWKGSDNIGAIRELLLTAVPFAVLTGGLWYWIRMPLGLLVVPISGYVLLAWLLLTRVEGQWGLGPANRVTFYRALGVVVLVSVLTEPQVPARIQWAWVVLALAILILDGLDGHLARRFGVSSAFGARFDMEVDAALILTLCLGVWILGITGPWVLLLGLMRYLFVAVGRVLPWINHPLPESVRRKTICVWQIASLVIVLVPVTPSWLAVWILAPALVLLAYSFIVDLAWLYRAGGKHETHRHGTET
ncbi:CDP-alcohol phosphatidyltransferase family protein [Vreelandella utahensis]|uniref:CDP-alcohol phosphatidyltransferase family protein n=1 Tax=Vreelandella halophila TaxID=86177 RepID=UPI0015C2F677|nr:CDP-alcohol phosphatidyltransferase family protein [Halomonas utahensis]